MSGIRHLTVTPLWPLANGSVERQTRTLLKAIRTAVAEGRSWPSTLQTFLLVYRTTPHPATGASPAQLLCGRQLRTKMSAVPRLEPAHGRPAVQQKNLHYREEAKRHADLRRRAVQPHIKVGDKVLVKIPKRLTKLSSAFFEESYAVVSVNGSRVSVKIPSDGRLFVRNSSFVKRYFGGSTTRDFVEPMLSVPCNKGPVRNVSLASEPVDESADRTQTSE